MNGCSQVNKMEKNRNNDHSEQLHTWLFIHHVFSYTLGDRKMGRCFRKLPSAAVSLGRAPKKPPNSTSGAGVSLKFRSVFHLLFSVAPTKLIVGRRYPTFPWLRGI